MHSKHPSSFTHPIRQRAHRARSRGHGRMRVFETAGSTHVPRVAKILACDEPAVLPEADAVAAPAPPLVAHLLSIGWSAAPLLIHEEWGAGVSTHLRLVLELKVGQLVLC